MAQSENTINDPNSDDWALQQFTDSSRLSWDIYQKMLMYKEALRSIADDTPDFWPSSCHRRMAALTLGREESDICRLQKDIHSVPVRSKETTHETLWNE